MEKIFDIKNRIKQLLTIAKNSKKKTVFFISNTKKLEKVPYYLSPIRENKNFVHTGVVLFSDLMTKEICKLIDGKVQNIFVDTEKKSHLVGKNIINIEKTVKESIKKSNLRFYKANDLTVNAVEDFLNIFFKDDVRGISGKKILIIGAGNIGFKLGLKLVERGSTVFLNRRNNKRLNKICELINFIKPKGTFAKAKPLNNINRRMEEFDIILCASNNQNVISFDDLKNFKKKVVIIDIGKGMFTKRTLNLLYDRNIRVFRHNVELSLNILAESSDLFREYANNLNYYQNKTKKFTLLSNGILGREGDIIVDNPNKPKLIYGICNGKGDFYRLNQKEKNLFKKKFSLYFKNQVKFY